MGRAVQIGSRSTVVKGVKTKASSSKSKKVCEDGSKCKYRHEYQHQLEYDHPGESDRSSSSFKAFAGHAHKLGGKSNSNSKVQTKSISNKSILPTPTAAQVPSINRAQSSSSRGIVSEEDAQLQLALELSKNERFDSHHHASDEEDKQLMEAIRRSRHTT
jgi:hypothetical protein